MTRKRFVCRSKPPRFKQIVIEGNRKRTMFHRKQILKNDNDNKHDNTRFDVLPSTSAATPPDIPAEQQQGPTTNTSKYAEKRQKLLAAWETLRQEMLEVRMEEMSPATHICQRCGTQEEEIIRCLDCSTVAYYCHRCNEDVHSTVLFHVPNIWKGTMFIPIASREKPALKRLDHTCAFAYIREICIIDVKGLQHRVNMHFCSCEKEAITITRYGFWPATPEQPKVAFEIDFMELATVLQLESHLPIRSFCDALQFMNRFRIHDVKQVKDVYRVVVGDSSNEYRYHRTYFSSGKHLDCGLDFGTCPACRKNRGKMVICMDANFGLVHKKSVSTQLMSAARHVFDPFFHSQEDVDNFVANYQDSKKTEGCVTFQAGSAVRSKVKNCKLDITGVFGSVCKHDHPLKMCNLRHGERLAYSVHHLESHLNESGEQEVIAMYDIACMLHKHLMKNKRADIVEKTLFAVPIFHSFAHNMSCQLLYGQRHVEGTGLTDGEGVERLWSFLRRFAKMSKEMTLGNRHDLLVDALHHYSRKLNQKLSDRLMARYNKACIQKESAVNAIQSVSDKPLSEIAELYEDRKSSVRSRGNSKVNGCEIQTKPISDIENISVEEEYSWIISQTENTRRQLEMDTMSEEAKSKLTKELVRNDSQLSKLEKKLKIIVRWNSTEERTRQCLNSYKKKTKLSLVKQIRDQCIERQYLLSLMKKYSDGQDIAIRLGKQLQTVTGKLRCFLTEINTLSDKEYIFKDVSELSSELLCDRDEGLQTNDEIFNLFVVLRRAEEEIELSKEDMISFINWIREQLQILNERLSVIDFGSSESRKAKGEKTLLLLLKMEFENQHIDTVSKFSKCLNVDLGVPQTDVMDFVMTCLSLGHLPDAIPDDDVSETLEVIDSYESEKADEPEIDDDSDDET